VKPRKIVVEERNENNEIVRQIVEKAKKRKVTALKKAILKKRERELKRTQRNLQKSSAHIDIDANIAKDDEDCLSSGYVTIDENYENGTLVIKQLSKKVQQPTNHEKHNSHLLVSTKGLPYAAIFKDFENACLKVEEDYSRRILKIS